MNRNVWVLFGCQALLVSMASFVVMVGGLIGNSLAPDPAYATTPVAIFIIGTALSTLPITLSMKRFGRKPVFLFCSCIATAAALMAAQATVMESFPLFLFAIALMGVALAAGQQFRFAAMESVAPEHMTKAASRVLLGGLVAAFIGPELVVRGENLFGSAFQGSFYLLAGVNVLALCLMLGFRETKVQHALSDAEPRPWGILLRQPVLWAAIISAAVGFAVMSLVMTATPLHMHEVNGHSLDSTKWVIQSHIMAMFIPSFIFPWLVSRFGVGRLLIAGLAMYLIAIAVVFSHYDFANYWVALVLLGIGWNFLFIGGTTLLPQSYHDNERFRIQALNEFTVFGVQATAAVGSGWLMFRFGWQNLLLTVIPLVVILIIALLIWRRPQRETPDDIKLESTTA
ncbi:MAG: MFS transporter [Porticoccaceae bacterium]